MFPEIARDDVFRLETRRLWLRWPRMADVEAIKRYAGDRDVALQTARIPHPMTESYAETFVLEARQANADGTGQFLAITPRDRPENLIGVASIFRARAVDPMLGYWLGRPFWGQGLATEAAQALIDITFDIADLSALSATVAPLNAASRRVLGHCGFAFVGTGISEAPARGGAQPVDFFRLERSTWASLKGWRAPRFIRDEQMQMQMAVS